MIQSNELRKGNCVLCEGDICIVHEITTSMALNSIHPIPLTEEMILRCGFEEVGMYSNVYHRDNTRIHTDKKGRVGKVLFLMYDDDDNLVLKKEISSVHQLQNLYFALIGEELELDLYNIE